MRLVTYSASSSNNTITNRSAIIDLLIRIQDINSGATTRSLRPSYRDVCVNTYGPNVKYSVIKIVNNLLFDYNNRPRPIFKNVVVSINYIHITNQ